MADFGGFQVKTPQEVLAELQAMRQRIASLPPAQQRTANIQFQIANMFGNPELKKARQTEAAMQAVQTDMARSGLKPGSHEWESQRLQKMYSVLKDSDPMAAAQIAEQMTVLDEERFQRELLINRENREQAGFETVQALRAQDMVANDMNNLQESIKYIRTEDANGNEVFTPYDIGDRQSRMEFMRARNQPGASAWSREEVVDHLGSAPGYEDFLNKSDLSKQRDTLRATTATFNRANRLLSVLADNPAANTNISALDTAINEAANDARQAVQRTGDFIGMSDNAALARIDSVLGGIEDFSQEYAKDKAFWQALTLNMAYTMARSLDPSGRLSDADVMFAAKMIGAALGQPETIARVLTEQIERTYQDNASLGNSFRKLKQRSPGQDYLIGFADEMDAARQSYYGTLQRGGWITNDELESIQTPGVSAIPKSQVEIDAAIDEELADDPEDDTDYGF